MKDFEIKLVPENSYYPTHDINYSNGVYNHVMTNPNTNEVTNSTGVVIPKVYHDKYDFELTSDWYENIAGEIVISGEDSSIVAGLNTRTGEITVNVDFDTPDGQVATDTIVRIGGDLGTHRVVKYADDGYLVKAEKQFYEPETYTVFINPENVIETVNLFLERKQSTWTEQSRTEPVPFETQYNEDINTRPENSYTEVHGVDGVRTFNEEREYIENIWTGLIRNQTSSVTTQPVTQIEIIGTAVIEWVERTRTETEEYTTSYVETDTLYEGETEVGTPGRDGVTVYAWEVELMNGDETGNRTDEEVRSHQARIDEVVLVGTKARSILSTEYSFGVNQYGAEVYYFEWLEFPDTEKEYLVSATISGDIQRIGVRRADGKHSAINGFEAVSSTPTIIPGSWLFAYNAFSDMVGLRAINQPTPPTYTITVEEVT